MHGCIDGATRLVVFLSASNNNRSSTVFNSFVKATAYYGLPNLLRVDAGGENTDTVLLMNIFGTAITGKSVHNQRIERLWVDVWKGVINVYSGMFHKMEADNILDPSNEVHIWLLHYIFLPRINRSLELFRNQWNSHGLRTESNMSPMQLFVKGAIQNRNSSLSCISHLFEPPSTEPSSPGVPQEFQQQFEQDWEGVSVPNTFQPISDDQFESLQQQVNPLNDTPDNGVSLYAQAVEMLSNFQ